MILKNQVEWALHCCVVLAGLPEGRYLSTRSLAELHGVPKEYLSKALQALSQAGLVATTLGPNGGYRLARDAADISFLDVVEALEGKTSTFACSEIRGNNPCRPGDFSDSRPCIIARAMWQADEAWRSALRQQNLADVVDTLARELPARLLSDTREWVMNRAGR